MFYNKHKWREIFKIAKLIGSPYIPIYNGTIDHTMKNILYIHILVNPYINAIKSKLAGRPINGAIIGYELL